jgi:hypothetical protein
MLQDVNPEFTQGYLSEAVVSAEICPTNRFLQKNTEKLHV